MSHFLAINSIEQKNNLPDWQGIINEIIDELKEKQKETDNKFSAVIEKYEWLLNTIELRGNTDLKVAKERLNK